VTEADPIDDARRALGKRLAAFRKAVGYSQTDLAAQIGYSRSAIGPVLDVRFVRRSMEPGTPHDSAFRRLPRPRVRHPVQPGPRSPD
jgi:hypothetical protein